MQCKPPSRRRLNNRIGPLCFLHVPTEEVETTFAIYFSSFIYSRGFWPLRVREGSHYTTYHLIIRTRDDQGNNTNNTCLIINNQPF
jgi:hypothetical protein